MSCTRRPKSEHSIQVHVAGPVVSTESGFGMRESYLLVDYQHYILKKLMIYLKEKMTNQLYGMNVFIKKSDKMVHLTTSIQSF